MDQRGGLLTWHNSRHPHPVLGHRKPRRHLAPLAPPVTPALGLLGQPGVHMLPLPGPGSGGQVPSSRSGAISSKRRPGGFPPSRKKHGDKEENWKQKGWRVGDAPAGAPSLGQEAVPYSSCHCICAYPPSLDGATQGPPYPLPSGLWIT